MPFRRRWLAVVVLAAVVTAALLIGFGRTTPSDAVAAAASRSESAGGAKLAMTIAVSDASNQKSATISASGVFDKSDADLNVDLSGLGSGSGLSLPAALGNLELRYLQESGDPVVYVNAPFLGAMLPGGKSWIRADLEQAGQAAGIDLNQYLNQSSQNPGEVLDMLRASGSVQQVGTESVDGVETTHYTASIDLAKAAQLQGQQGQAFVDRLTAAGAPTEIPLDVWIGNDDGFVHKLTVDEQLKDVTLDLTLDISDYGTAVNVTAPPSDQVFDVTDLASKAAAAAKSAGLRGTH